MQLHDCCLERTAKDNSGVGTLRKKSVKPVLFLIDASDIKESLELDIGNGRYLALLSLLGWPLFLGWRPVCLEVKRGEDVKEAWYRLRIVL